MNNFWKDLFRTIKHSFGRFLAIAGICALGVGFFGGLQMTCGSMKYSLTEYYNDTNMMDIRIVSDYGISQENIEVYKKVKGVNSVMPSCETDILTNFGNDQCAVRVHSLPDLLDWNDSGFINRPILSRGQWPKNNNECVLSDDVILSDKPEIGDEITILECSTGIDKTINVDKLKIVGFVHSSYYVASAQMGPSVLGKGIVNQFAYVHSSFFKDSFQYSEVFLTVEGANKFVTGTKAYQERVDEAMLELASVSPQQAEIRTASIKEEAQKKLDEAKQSFEEEKHKAEEELNKNEEKLKEAWQQIEQNESPLLEAQQLLDSQYQEFNSEKSAVLDPLNQLIYDSETCIKITKELQIKHKVDVENVHTYAAQVESIDTCVDGLNNLEKQLNLSINVYSDLITILQTYLPAQEIIDFMQMCITDTKEFQSFVHQFYLAMLQTPTQETYDSYISDFHAKYSNINYSLLNREWIFDNIINEFDYLLISTLYPSRDEAVAAFDELEKPLIEAKIKLNLAFDELNNGKNEYFSGLQAFTDAKVKALSSLNNAQVKLNDSQKSIDGIENPSFYIMDRTKNFGAINFNNDAERIANIANVFPLMFFFVALLVVLTSMTRMIEEERTTIGTYKALGFSKYRISNKYLLYGIFASITGSVFGLIVLTQFFPWIIIYAYKTMYTLPIPLPMPFDWTIALLSLALGVGLTIIAILMAAVRSLKLSPANLMIPKAPKAGKRIFLEHIKPVWKHLKFNWKISFRNMFLYKKRLFMTLIGIAGCTALLLTGFGLHDSISDIMNKQFDEIAFDNFKVVFEEGASEAQQNETINSAINIEHNFTNTLVHEENVLCMLEGHPNATTKIIVPKNIEQFQNLRLMKNRITQQHFTIDDQGVYVSEKLANLLNVQYGDKIEVYNQDLIGNAGSEKYEFYIAGVVENYIAHYIYMSPNLYKQYFNKDCLYDSLIARSNLYGNDQQVLIDNIKSNPCVKSAYFTTSNRDLYERSLQSVNMVVVILIVSAGLLAFVVLYNLININICERTREIATLKVLGSNRHEINMYIHRETFMLSILGSILGLGLGYVLEQFVIASAEVDYVMFGKMIYIWSYLFSFGITLIFTIVVVLFMRNKLFSISMVESLKSVE